MKKLHLFASLAVLVLLASLCNAAEPGTIFVDSSRPVIHKWKKYVPVYRSMAFSPEGKNLVVSVIHPKTELLVFNLADGEVIKRLRIENISNRLIFSPDGKKLLCLSDSDALLLNTDFSGSEKPIKSFSFFENGAAHTNLGNIINAAFTPDGKSIIAMNKYGITMTPVEEFAKGRLSIFVQTRTGPVMALSPDGTRLACLVGKYLFLYDVQTRKEIWRTRTIGNNIAFSPDGLTIAAVGPVEMSEGKDFKSALEIISTQWGKVAQTFQMKKSDIYSRPAFSPDGKVLALGGDKTEKISLWNIENGELLAELDRAPAKHSFWHNDLYAMAVSPDGKSLAAASSQWIDLWDFWIDPTEWVKIRKGEFESNTEFARRISSWKAPYAAPVKIGAYSADSESFEAQFESQNFAVPVPRAKAKGVSERKDQLLIQGTVKYYDPQKLVFTDAKIVDKDTGETVASLKLGDPPKAGSADAAATGGVSAVPDFKASARPLDVAVVIGIEKYRALPKSDYSQSDALLVKNYLKALGFEDRNITLLTDDGATLSDIRKTLESWLPNRVKDRSRVIIYYSGHGAPEPVSGSAYIVPYDGDPNYLEDTGYPLKRLYERLGKLHAAEVIVLLDSCFSGAGGRSVLGQGVRPLVMMKEQPLTSENIAVMSATQGGQISTSSKEKGHGVFTFYFLQSLKDGKSGIAEIYRDIKPQVENEARTLNIQQSPSLNPAAERLTGKFDLRR